MKKLFFSFFCLFMMLLSTSVMAELNRDVLLKNLESNFATIIKNNPNVKITKDNIKIKKAVRINADGKEFYFVEVEIDHPQNTSKKPIRFVTDKDGSLAYGDLIDIATGKSLVKPVFMEATREKMPENLGEVLFTGNGKHTVYLFSDPFCPFCRRAFDYFNQNDVLAKIKELKLVHHPLAMHPGADIACWLIERAYKNKHNYLETVKYFYSEFNPRTISSPENANREILEQYKTRFGLNYDVDSMLKEFGGKYEGQRHRFQISGTPVIYIDGYRVDGFNLKQIESLLR